MRSAEAIPYFAHEYGLSCQKCHTAVPRLTPFGTAFLERGYRLEGVTRGGAVPISARVNFAYTSATDPTGLPKAIVDEVELIGAGSIGARGSYVAEQYLVDGGVRGETRDLWYAQRVSPDAWKVPVTVQLGQFTLPLPLDPETFRESAQHYTIWDQKVGNNPFTFFDPKIGLMASIGDRSAGASVRVAALQGHDRNSGLPSRGTDTMIAVQDAFGPFVAGAYRYGGARPDTQATNRFARYGYGLTWAARRWEIDGMLQRGQDASADGNGGAASSSGGFLQARYDIGRRLFALGRYEGTNAPDGMARDTVLLLGYRLGHNTRLTLEDVVAHTPTTTHTFNAHYTLGY